jgi:hypothetical protein
MSKVYCFTEPKRHTAVFNGILTSQCNEITLPTGIDYAGKKRTAVCCLSSLNLADKYDCFFPIDFAAADILENISPVLFLITLKGTPLTL